MVENTEFRNNKVIEYHTPGEQKSFKYIVANEYDDFLFLKVRLPNPESQTRLTNEIQNTKNISSYEKVEMYDNSDEKKNRDPKYDTFPWILKDFVPGAPLNMFIDLKEQFTLRTKFEIFYGIARELNSIHAKGKVHGHVNPKNILLDSMLRPHLLKYQDLIENGKKIMIQKSNFFPEGKESIVATPSLDIYQLGMTIKSVITLSDLVYGDISQLDDKMKKITDKHDRQFLELADMCTRKGKPVSIKQIMMILKDGGSLLLRPKDNDCLKRNFKELKDKYGENQIKQVLVNVYDYALFREYIKPKNMKKIGSRDMVDIALIVGFQDVNSNMTRLMELVNSSKNHQEGNRLKKAFSIGEYIKNTLSILIEIDSHVLKEVNLPVERPNGSALKSSLTNTKLKSTSKPTFALLKPKPEPQPEPAKEPKPKPKPKAIEEESSSESPEEPTKEQAPEAKEESLNSEEEEAKAEIIDEEI